jgi:hypothetical protein
VHRLQSHSRTDRIGLAFGGRFTRNGDKHHAGAVRVVEIELVHEFVERHGKFGRRCLRNPCDFRKRLLAPHHPKRRFCRKPRHRSRRFSYCCTNEYDIAGSPRANDANELTELIKAAPVECCGPADEHHFDRESTAREEIDERFVLRRGAGVFAARDARESHAPTGGYLAANFIRDADPIQEARTSWRLRNFWRTASTRSGVMCVHPLR